MYSKYKNELLEIFRYNNVIDLVKADKICGCFFDNHTCAHLSVEEIETILRVRSGEIITSQEIKEILDILVKYGFAKQFAFANDNIVRYEPARFDEHHDHFVCARCKRIVEFYDENFERLQKQISGRFGLLLYHKLELYGVCKECLNIADKQIPLNHIESGNAVELVKINAGDELKARLAQLGFTPTEKITVINNSGFGPVIVEIKASRIALGFGEASKIMVKQCQ